MQSSCCSQFRVGLSSDFGVYTPLKAQNERSYSHFIDASTTRNVRKLIQYFDLFCALLHNEPFVFVSIGHEHRAFMHF